MPEAPLLPHTPLQRQIAQMALDLAIKLEEKAGQAPLGGVLDACEALLLDQGCQMLRDSLAATLQHQADEACKKGGPRAPARAATPAATKGPAPASSSPPSAPSASAAPISPARPAAWAATASMSASASTAGCPPAPRR